MDTAQATAQQSANQPLLLELDQGSWDDKIDAIQQWLDNAVMVQAGFRQLAEDVRDKLHEPHFRDLVTEIAETAARHERLAESLYDAIGRQPPTSRKLSGKLLSPMRRAWADALGTAGGAAAPFRDLQQLLMASMNATTAFATAEQLGLAMGIEQLAEISFRIVAEKYPHHLVLQEIALESAATAVLYRAELAEPERGEHRFARPTTSTASVTGLALGAVAMTVTLGLLLSSDRRRQ